MARKLTDKEMQILPYTENIPLTCYFAKYISQFELNEILNYSDDDTDVLEELFRRSSYNRGVYKDGKCL